MSTLTREPEAVEATPDAPEAPGTPPAEPPAPRTCPTCSATLADGQDWCLECGTAQPEAELARPSWRSAAAVLAATGLLAAGAVAAAYAGLSADAKKAAAPNAQAALPTTPDVPPAQQQPAAPTPPPAQTTPPPATTTPPPAAKTPVPTPPASTATPTPTPTPPAATKPSTPSGTTSKPQTTTTEKAAPKKAPAGPLVAVKLTDADVAVYNPYGRAESDFTDPKATVDGDPATAWTAKLNSGSPVGVVLDAGKSLGLRSLTLSTPTPGMTVEIYAARGAQPPVSIQDPKWEHVATQLDVAKTQRIRLGDGTDEYRWVAIWPTEAPPDAEPGAEQVALSELKLFR